MSKRHPPKPTTPAKRSAILYLRAILALLLLGVLIAVLYWWGYNSYPDVADWAESGSHEAIVYNEETYYLSGQIGKKNLSKNKYAIDKVLGQVKGDSLPALTDSETTEAAETESTLETEKAETEEGTETETEIESVIPPAGVELFQKDQHTYILYSVEKSEEFLILLAEDGNHYLYYREGTKNPLVVR